MTAWTHPNTENHLALDVKGAELEETTVERSVVRLEKGLPMVCIFICIEFFVTSFISGSGQNILCSGCLLLMGSHQVMHSDENCLLCDTAFKYHLTHHPRCGVQALALRVWCLATLPRFPLGLLQALHGALFC